LNSEDTHIVSYKVPPKNLTPYYSVPDQARLDLDLVFKDSPVGARRLDACIIGAPNAGKSSLINVLVNKNVSAVSDKYNTTDETITGIVTDYQERAQLVLLDTPGVTKANQSMRSSLLVSEAWGQLPQQDLAIMVVDGVKRLSSEVKGAVVRLNSTKVDPSDRKLNEAIKDGTFS
jgi:small GTP-binding protein